MDELETQTLSGPPGRAAKLSFAVVGEEVRRVRQWGAEVLPPGCVLVDDCRSVVSELVGNAVAHGLVGGAASLALSHTGAGTVVGRLVQFGTPQGLPEVGEGARAEMAALLGVAGRVPEVADLGDGGRGLPIVQMLCEELDVRLLPDRLVITWVQTGCACGVSP